MKLLMPERIGYKGPDPPPVDWTVGDLDAAQNESPAPGKPLAKGKTEIVAPVEVTKSPEIEAADKSVRRFMKVFMTSVIAMQTDLNVYRSYAAEVKTIALWPKILSPQEIQAIKDKDEADRKAAEEAEALAAQEAALANSTNPGKPVKGAPPAKAAPQTPIRPGSSTKDVITPRPGTSNSARAKIETAAAMSVDDDPKEWNFVYFNRAVNDMKAESASAGSILAAMIYQIEEQNKSVPASSSQHANANKSATSLVPQFHETNKDSIFSQLDDMFNKVAFENAAI